MKALIKDQLFTKLQPSMLEVKLLKRENYAENSQIAANQLVRITIQLRLKVSNNLIQSSHLKHKKTIN
jgi:hypothetical protein